MSKHLGRHRATWRARLNLVVNVVLLAAGMAVLYQSFGRPGPPKPQGPPVPSEIVTLGGDEIRGNADAPVVLIEYADFQCPFCGRFSRDIFPALVERYVKDGKLAIVFRHYPLQDIHPEAFAAAAVSACAGPAFWQVHDGLFARQADLARADIRKIATLAGLKDTTVEVCAMKDGAERVRKQIESGERLQVQSTPVFFAGLRVQTGVKVRSVIAGARPLADFSKVIDTLVKAADQNR